MPMPTLNSIQSPEYEKISRFFFGLEPPYSEMTVREFNRLYREIYPHLSSQEQRKAEWLVDLLISQLENKDLAPLIYGVV